MDTTTETIAELRRDAAANINRMRNLSDPTGDNTNWQDHCDSALAQLQQDVDETRARLMITRLYDELATADIGEGWS